jgi:hypothetical protein
VWLLGKQPAGELALERDEGEAVAEKVVQIPGEPEPLLVDGHPGQLLPRRPELATAATCRTKAVAHNPTAAVGSTSQAMPETRPRPNEVAARPAIAT